MGSFRTRISLSVAAVALACCGGTPEGSSSGPKVDPPAAPPLAPVPWVAPQRSGCAAGQAPDGSGGCLAPGVSQCAQGFERSNAESCRAVLPAAPCAPGTMALPGEAQCRLVAPCGNGTWGDIPTSASTQFVDASYAGNDSDGTAAKPWTKIKDAYTAAAAGATIAIAAGKYDELLDINAKPVVLAGRCPSMVEIHSTSDAVSPVLVRGGADNSVVRGVALTSAGPGLMLSGAKDLLVENVWIHETKSFAATLADAWGPASVTMRGVLVEDYHDVAGISILGVTAVIESSVVRNATPQGSATRGVGIDVESFPARGKGQLTLRSSIIDDVVEAGLFVYGAAADVDATVIRDTKSNLEGAFGNGITIQPGEDLPRSVVKIRRSVVERNRDVGVLAVAADLEMTDSVVRDTGPSTKGFGGRGLQVQVEAKLGKQERPRLTLSRSVVEGNHEGGVVLLSTVGTLDSVLVRDTQARIDNGKLGLGLVVEYAPIAGMTFADAIPSEVDVRFTRVERSRVIGAVVTGSTVRMESVAVDGTTPQQSDGAFGDGVVVLGGPVPAKLTMTGSRVTGNARAGVANFAADAEISSSDVHCNTLDLDGETLDESLFQYADKGENSCGCNPNPTFCRVLSARLQPPTL